MRTNRRLVRLSRKIRARQRLAKMPKENTRPELHTQQILTQLNHEFVTQFPIYSYLYDIYVPGKKILIEVSGDYWHSHPIKYRRKRDRLQMRNYRRDQRKLILALGHGYSIIYIWESDLKNRATAVKQQLEEALTNSFSGYRMLLDNVFQEYRTFYKVRLRENMYRVQETKANQAILQTPNASE